MAAAQGKITVFAICVLTGSSSLAQAPGQPPEIIGGIRIFEPAYFLQFDPVTALDLVQQTPGFNPQQQNGGRGLAGVRTNILINGRRPPPKGQSIWEQLSNRPYTSVNRIELINTSADLDIDMQGYQQVVNVHLEEGDSDYFEMDTRYQRTGDGDDRQRNERSKEVELTGNLVLGAHTINMQGGIDQRDTRMPADFVDIDPANPVQRVSSQNQENRDEHFLQVNSVFNFSSDSSLSVNAELSAREEDSFPVIVPDSTGAIPAVNESSLGERDFQEISAEYIQPVGERSNLMLAVVDSRTIDVSEFTFAIEQDLLSSIRNRESGETAARLRLTHDYSNDLILRGIVSSAFNYFEGSFSRLENGQPQNLSGSDSRVEEYRHSLTLEADWNWKDSWLLRGSLSGGTYAIDAMEVSSNEQTEVKGRFSVDYQPAERTTISWQSRYDIGQLSLNQFLASSNLSSEILQAGAVSLNSERSWEHTLGYDQRFGDRGVFQATLGHYNLTNPIRTVALSDSLIVSQNTQPQKISWFEAELEYPFEQFGMPDLVLEADFTLRDSETVDPVTGETREVSWAEPFQYSLGLRKNPGDSKWSWGMNLWRSINNRNYRVRETNLWQRSHQWQAFIQYEFFQGLWLNVRFESPRTDRNLQEFYDAVRRPGLEPFFLAATNSRRDSSPRVSLQWRRDKYMEITAVINPRPRYTSTEFLSEFGATQGTLLGREIAQSPRAEIRFRLYNR